MSHNYQKTTQNILKHPEKNIQKTSKKGTKVSQNLQKKHIPKHYKKSQNIPTHPKIVQKQTKMAQNIQKCLKTSLNVSKHSAISKNVPTVHGTQTRPDQTKPDQTWPDQNRPEIFQSFLRTFRIWLWFPCTCLNNYRCLWTKIATALLNFWTSDALTLLNYITSATLALLKCWSSATLELLNYYTSAALALLNYSTSEPVQLPPSNYQDTDQVAPCTTDLLTSAARTILNYWTRVALALLKYLASAVWVKADWVKKSDMIVLLKVNTIPFFLCNTENISHCCLNQLKGSLP